MPVFAEELMYREYYYYFFSFSFFFSTSHRFPWVGSGFPLDAQKEANRRSKQSGAILRDVPLVNCEVDMVVLSSYCSLAT